MKKLLAKLKNVTQNFFIGALFGWFALAITFDLTAIITYTFFPETWSEITYHMNQLLGI
jgi:hypothetical protein